MYDAVLEMVLCGFTEIVAENLKTEIERLEQKELNKFLTGFETEFQVKSIHSSSDPYNTSFPHNISPHSLVQKSHFFGLEPCLSCAYTRRVQGCFTPQEQIKESRQQNLPK